MFTGSIVALVTPMDDKGQVDRASLKKLIDYHVASGTSAIVSVGTTGESATLNHDEHVDVVLQTLDLADGRIPVIAGAGANATAEAIALTERFNNTGVVGCLTVTPYYNKPMQEGLFQHFKAIAEHTDLPQILYNVPSRTGNLSRVSQIQELVNDDSFILLSGDDATALDFMQLGGQGVISVTANVAAREMAELCKLAADGDFAKARKLNQRLMALHQQLFVEANPIPVKWACKVLGLIATDTMRLPMTPISDKARPVVEQALKHVGLL